MTNETTPAEVPVDRPVMAAWRRGSELPPRWRNGPESETVLAVAETSDGALQMTLARVVAMSKKEWREVRFDHDGMGQKLVVRCWTPLPAFPRHVPDAP